MTSVGRLERVFERLLMPPLSEGELKDALVDAPARADDFRRIVYFVALVAVGFFVPSLALANVPPDRWLAFTASAGLAGFVLGGSFVVIRHGSRLAYGAVIVNGVVLAGLALEYGRYYNQLGLAFAMIIGAHAVLHGLGPALLGALLGGALVPLAIQANLPTNATDPIYAVIYLFGAAVLPWSGRELARRRTSALRHQLQVTQETEREAVLILARAAEAKDEATGDHVARVGDLSYELGTRAGMTDAEAEDLRFAAMLHDVGKLHVPDSILSKPGRLTREEWKLVQLHTIWGERILGSTAGFELARRVARSHHENFDGTGYPDKLSQTGIPLVARVVRLADVFDALRSDRPYKPRWEFTRCLEELELRSNELFDPDLARLFVAYLDEHRVELEGETALLHFTGRRRAALNRAPTQVSLPESALNR